MDMRFPSTPTAFPAPPRWRPKAQKRIRPNMRLWHHRIAPVALDVEQTAATTPGIDTMARANRQDAIALRKAPASGKRPAGSRVRAADTDLCLSTWIWNQKYRYKNGESIVDLTLDDTWRRVAKAIASIESPAQQAVWEDAYYRIMRGLEFLPAGRILCGAGTGRDVTLMNTFAMGTFEDSVAGVMAIAHEAARTMQMGGGIGYDFSTLAPSSNRAASAGHRTIGPLTAMDLCNAVSALTNESANRGAMMATLRCDHPDIESFICAKNEPGKLRNFNLSVLVTDAFMDCVRNDRDWTLIWQGKAVKTLPARALWQKIMAQAYATAEPGVLFIDRINSQNPLNYIERIATTNSCAEQPLPPHGTAPLGSINLARLIVRPFEADSHLDLPRLRELVRVAVRMLDATIDLSRYPLPEQRREALAKRRIGLGVTGVGDALMMLGLRYGSTAAARMLSRWMREIHEVATRSSIELAREKGPFPALDANAYLASAGKQSLRSDLRNAIRTHGIRNALVTSIAPTGSISLLAGNVSSGIEPIFALSFQRKIRQPDGRVTTETVTDYAYDLYRRKFGPDRPLPDSAVTAMNLTPDDHIRMQAAAQKWIDSSISKTVNCPEDIDLSAFEQIYRSAYDAGCKGCSTYRPNPITGSILST